MSITACAFLVSSCGTPEPAKTLNIRGTIVIKALNVTANGPSGERVTKFGDKCAGSGQYGDIVAGGKVIIYNARDEKIALGEIGEGKSLGEYGHYCEIPFAADDVADDGTIYSVEIPHGEKVTFGKSESDSIRVTLGY